MKKTLLLFGATVMLSTMLTSCTKQEDKPKNYYGVQSDDTSGTPKEAYWAFFIGLVVIIFALVYFLRKIGKK